jgi:hypothetical protein
MGPPRRPYIHSQIRASLLEMRDFPSEICDLLGQFRDLLSRTRALPSQIRHLPENFGHSPSENVRFLWEKSRWLFRFPDLLCAIQRLPVDFQQLRRGRRTSQRIN